MYKRSLAIDEKIYGPDHPEVATDLNNWARLLESQVRTAINFQESCDVQLMFALPPGVVFGVSTKRRAPYIFDLLVLRLGRRAWLLRIYSSAVRSTGLDHITIAFLPYIILIFILIGQVRGGGTVVQALACYR